LNEWQVPILRSICLITITTLHVKVCQTQAVSQGSHILSKLVEVAFIMILPKYPVDVAYIMILGRQPFYFIYCTI
jgi:hypothetical protein